MEPSCKRPENTEPVVQVTKRAFNQNVVTLYKSDQTYVWLHYPGECGGQVLFREHLTDPTALRGFLLDWLKAHLKAAGVKMED